jgi:hypothetical protein
LPQIQPPSSVDIRSSLGGDVRAAQQSATGVAQVPKPWLSIHQFYGSLRGLGAGCQQQAVGVPDSLFTQPYNAKLKEREPVNAL